MKAKLESYIKRIEALEIEKKNITGDINEIYAEAKHDGLDPKALRATIRRRKMSKKDRDDFDDTLQNYEDLIK